MFNTYDGPLKTIRRFAIIPVQVIINVLELGKIIIDVIVQHHRLFNLIISNYNSVFISEFWFINWLVSKNALTTA